MRIIYQKIWADLWGAKARTLQVALIVALGAFGIGLVVGGRNLIVDALNTDWQTVKAPAINLNVDPAMNDEELTALKNIEGVEEVEGLARTVVEWRAAPTDEWQPAFLNARSDYRDQKMSKDFLLSGEWPARNQVAVAAGAESFFGIKQGDTVWLRIAGRERQVEVGGVLKSLRSAPFFSGSPDFFITRSRFADLLGNADYDNVQISVGEFDQARAEQVDRAIQERLEKLGIDSQGANQPQRNRIAPPDVQPASTLLDAIFAIMGIVGAAIIFLGLFLVFNSVSAIITQQINQIGVLKAIGARSDQILRGYLLLIAVYGLLATLIAAPLAALAANALKDFFLNITNTTNPGFAIDPLALVIQLVVAMVAPLVAALSPVLKGVRITVREAISTYGITGTAGLVEELVSRARGIPYTWLLTIGNTFRNRRRVLLLQVTLVGSGLIFMVIMGVFDSTAYTFGEQLKATHTYQAGLALLEPQRLKRIETEALADQQIRAVELWITDRARARPSSQAEPSVEDEQVTLLGLPVNTTMYRPQLVAGRWLSQEDQDGVVLHKALAAKLGVTVGDQVTFNRDGDKDSTWRVVGLLFDPVNNRLAYLPREPLARFMGAANKANAVWVQTRESSAEEIKRASVALEERLKARNMEVAPRTVFGGDTIDEIVFSKRFTYNLLVQLLAILAVVIAAVGGIGLGGVLTLNVLERTREIGVMRAIGASSRQITGLFIGEGLLLGLISWLIALPFSLPLAYALTTQLLTTILNEEIIYRFTMRGPALWLAVMVVLSILASWLPARGATRVSVRESLAYQ